MALASTVMTTDPSVDLIGSLRGVQVLEAVSAHGSFSAAAVALGITQSAVSQQVAGLERLVSLPLVDRTVRPVALTQAGRMLVAHGGAAIARLDRASHDLAELAGRRGGRLRFGSFPTALTSFVPSALGRLRSRRPDVTLTVVDDHMQRLLPRLLDGQLDLALVYEHEAFELALRSQVTGVPLLDDRYRVVLPQRHRLTRGDAPIRLRDLADEDWVGGTGDSTWFQLVQEACGHAGFRPRVSLTSDDYLAVQAFVSAGLGVALLPGLAVTRRLPGVRVRDLRSGAPSRTIWAARPAEPYPPAPVVEMLDVLRAVTRKYAA